MRKEREWRLPTAEENPALHEYLPPGYGMSGFALDSGHDTAFVLTKDERAKIKALAPFHAHAPEPAELKQEDRAVLLPAAIKADNELRQKQVDLRPRINSAVYLLATLFDPALAVPQPALDRLAPVIAAQLSLIWDDLAKQDQLRKSKLLGHAPG